MANANVSPACNTDSCRVERGGLVKHDLVMGKPGSALDLSFSDSYDGA